jgi:hypothetical protein
VLDWLRRESIATLAMLGAALTVLAQLRHEVPFSPWLERLLGLWQEATRYFWQPPLEWVGVPLHRHLVAALTLASFLAMIGVGARVSGRLSGAPLRPIVLTRWLDGMTWPSLVVYAALVLVFMLGHGASAADPLVLWGSRTAGQYAFALTVTAGYIAGDYIGHEEFHRRLLRLAALVALLVVANLGALYLTRP